MICLCVVKELKQLTEWLGSSGAARGEAAEVCGMGKK